MMILEPQFYLGKLCPKGHDWHGLGMSVRRNVGRCCVACQKYYDKKNRDKDIATGKIQPKFRRLSADNKFFAVPNVLNSYWAGFIAADGAITNRRTVVINLSDRDATHLQRFAQDIGFTGQVRYYAAETKVFSGKTYECSPLARISVSCTTNWLPDLERNFLIVRRKSLILMPPFHLPLECAWAYMAGYFDGDGCAYTRLYGKSWQLQMIFYGTYEVLNWIKALCNDLAPSNRGVGAVLRPTASIFRYGIAGPRAKALACKLLELDIPRLQRKWDKIKAVL